MILIAAISLDGAIGHDDELLWHIPEDLKQYKEKTLGNICIVGVTTYDFLPLYALKGRTHIVISGNYGGDKMRSIDAPDETQPRFNLKTKEVIDTNAEVWNRSTLKEAIDLAEEIRGEDQKIYVIGGARIYESMIDLVDEAHITWINKLYPTANKRFPIDKLFNDFEITGDQNYVKSKSGLSYKFTYYERINKRYKLSKDD